jgi:transaldolase
MRSTSAKTKIFLDGGDPQETRNVLQSLGFLDGQTTNPTLIAKNPQAQQRLAGGQKFTEQEVYDFYQSVVQEISKLIPNGSISIEVYADASTTTQPMLKQGRQMFGWISNAQIKFPTTEAGLTAAEQLVKEGGRVNMTLCFSQEQAAAVYSATKGAKRGQVYVSPFIGRLDDQGKNGLDLIINIIKMFEAGDGHVEVLTASVRHLSHFLEALKLGSDIITAPAQVLTEWAGRGQLQPDREFVDQRNNLKPIAYRPINLDRPWQAYDISHPLTDRGLQRFANDWRSLIA